MHPSVGVNRRREKISAPAPVDDEFATPPGIGSIFMAFL